MTFVFFLKTFLRLVDHQIYYLNTGILEITFLKSDELYLMTTIDHYLQLCESGLGQMPSFQMSFQNRSYSFLWAHRFYQRRDMHILTEFKTTFNGLRSYLMISKLPKTSSF